MRKLSKTRCTFFTTFSDPRWLKYRILRVEIDVTKTNREKNEKNGMWLKHRILRVEMDFAVIWLLTQCGSSIVKYESKLMSEGLKKTCLSKEQEARFNF